MKLSRIYLITLIIFIAALIILSLSGCTVNRYLVFITPQQEYPDPQIIYRDFNDIDPGFYQHFDPDFGYIQLDIPPHDISDSLYFHVEDYYDPGPPVRSQDWLFLIDTLDVRPLTPYIFPGHVPIKFAE